MKRIVVGGGAVVGLAVVTVAVVMGVVAGGERSTSVLVPMVAALWAIPALMVATWKLRGRLDTTSNQPVPWADDERFATPAPERSSDDHSLSSDGLARRLQDAGATARSAGTVVDGVATVSPALRETLVEAMVRGEWDRESAREAVESGEWTDDPTAASVLAPDVSPPSMSIRQRVYAWLFPERVVRRRVRRAVQEVAEVADEALPTVPGQTAPRTVPVRKPRLAELRRDAEGRLQGAVDPDAIARGPDPPEPTLDPEDGDLGRGEEWESVGDGSDGFAGWGDDGDEWESIDGGRDGGADEWEPVTDGGTPGDGRDGGDRREGSDREVTDA